VIFKKLQFYLSASLRNLLKSGALMRPYPVLSIDGQKPFEKCYCIAFMKQQAK